MLRLIPIFLFAVLITSCEKEPLEPEVQNDILRVYSFGYDNSMNAYLYVAYWEEHPGTGTTAMNKFLDNYDNFYDTVCLANNQFTYCNEDYYHMFNQTLDGNYWLSNPDVVFWSVNNYFPVPNDIYNDNNSPVGNGWHYYAEHDINVSINNNDNIVYLN